MKKITLSLVVITAIGIGIYNIPTIKTKTYEREVDSLAFSYRVYNSQLCPNRKILRGIRSDYESTVDRNNVVKLAWIYNNFDQRFMSTCLQLNPHRGEYQ
ncbi:hypothetical protein ZZ1p0138 [Acinetobacter phage ZZ1]|jgi:hypothetical protein|uniref:Uncharacterized protein n=3 Tax=Caudoviricetes TaxID=2731619 RepID=A0A410T5I5_9CAUD|nr:hypothetical protein ZZ1p0138 [Acinetobacter phage ZZ1]AFL47441.1 hypothetical protein ZZ1p0138 [Acinetobacter phage ZZ1]QAU03990.1 hypothetical protein Henu6_gp187 [Acinetobacter phage Henu6]